MSTQPVALVTGTSSGIGLSAAIHLAKAGFHVVATMRDVSKAGPLKERAANDGVDVDDSLERFERRLLGRTHEAGARVVQQHIDTAATLED